MAASFRALLAVLTLFLAVAPAAGAQAPTPLEMAREESDVEDRPRSRFELPAGDLRLSASELLASSQQSLELTVTLDRAVQDGELEVTLPEQWLGRSGVSGLAYARVPDAGRRSRRSDRTVSFPFSGAAAGDSASFELTDNGLPAGTYELPYRWREGGRGVERGTATVILYAPVREAASEPEPFAAALSSGIEVNASADDEFQSETFLTVVPGDPSRFVVGANGGDAYGARITNDGGRTFTKANMPTSTDVPGSANPETLALCCDAMSAADATGTIWFGGISDDEGGPSRIFVNRIAPGQTSFQAQNTGLRKRTSGTQDKPMMTIDNSPDSPAYGRLYVAWNEPTDGGLKIVLVQCDTRPGGVLDAPRCDNADNWTAPVSVTSSSGSYIYADVAAGPDGKVHVVWWDFSATNSIRGDVCDPGTQNCAAAASWGTPQTIATLDASAGRPVPFSCPIVAQPGGRASTSPSVEVDRTDGPNRGRVYVAWSDLRTGSGTVKCKSTTTPTTNLLSWDAFVATAESGLPGGAASSPTVATRLLTDGADGGVANSDDWFPWIAVDQTTGQAWADFYSTRDDTTRKTTNFYVRSVTPADGGGVDLGALTRVSTAASDYSTEPCCDNGNQYGDYTGIDATDGVVLPVWSDKRTTGEGEIYVSVPAWATLAGAATGLDDSAAAGGDGDGALEPGESFRLTKALTNTGTDAVTGVTSRLTESSAELSLTQAASAYPDIAPGETKANATPFAGSLAASAPCGTPLTLNLAVDTDRGSTTIPVQLPVGATGAPSTSTASPAAPIPDNSTTGVQRTIALTGAGTVADLDVGVNVSHTYVSDLTISLRSPAGTTVVLTDKRGGEGANYTSTVFDDEAATAIGAGSAPFTGSFRPEQPLSALDGQAAAGTWTLKVVDSATGDTGTLDSWSLRTTRLTCSSGPAPQREVPSAGWSAPSPVKGDFDGDGYGDLAVGVPGEDMGTAPDAGSVHILYGSEAGLTATNSIMFHQNSPGVLDTGETGDGFGAALASGDLNGDGFGDLAIGAPGEDAGAGAVHVLYGSAARLSAAGNQRFLQGAGGVPGPSEPGDGFGSALAIADVGRATAGDLLVGAPGEGVATRESAGAVTALYGTTGGLSATGAQVWHQSAPDVIDAVEPGDRFGSTLAAADVGGDGRADAVIGVPTEDLGAISDAGVVHVLYGSAAGGLSAAASQRWHQGSSIGNAAEAGDHFGGALAAGDLGRTSHGDVAIGVPGEDLAAGADAGLVQTLYGTSTGLAATGTQQWNQSSTGIPDTAEPGDRFGAALAIADVGKTTESELMIGVPDEDLATTADAGVVHVLYGTAATGASASGSVRRFQGDGVVPGSARAGDRFGASLTALFGDTEQGDLVVGAAGEDLGAAADAGQVNVLYGGPDGISGVGAQTWHQNSLNVTDSAEPGDRFGAGLGR